MRRIRIAICIGKKPYGKKLAEYIGQAIKEEGDIWYYGNETKRREGKEQSIAETVDKVDLLLIEMDWPNIQEWSARASKRYFLVYDKQQGEENNCIYGYQSARAIYKELFWGSVRRDERKGKRQGRLALVYNRFHQSKVEPEICKELGEGGKLVVPFVDKVPIIPEESGKTMLDKLNLSEKQDLKLKEDKRDLLDLMYFCQEEEVNIRDKLVGVIEKQEFTRHELEERRIDSYDRITPPHNPMQVYEVSQEELYNTITRLESSSLYSWIILETDHLFPGCIDYFEKVEQIFMVGSLGDQQAYNDQVIRYLDRQLLERRRIEGGDHGEWESITRRVKRISARSN